MIGDAIDDRADSRAREAAQSSASAQCSDYLDAYMARASQSAPTTQFEPGKQYMLVPVTVEVAREAQYREVPVGSPGQ